MQTPAASPTNTGVVRRSTPSEKVRKGPVALRYSQPRPAPYSQPGRSAPRAVQRVNIVDVAGKALAIGNGDAPQEPADDESLGQRCDNG